jgi:CRP/FNR family transcriptional regulator, cyclic AMP receptor protein
MRVAFPRMAKRVYIDHLRNVSVFRDLSRRELEKIASMSDVVTLPAEYAMIEEGKTGREAFVLLEGSVRVTRNGRKANVLHPGAVFGELALFDRGPRTATVITETPCTVLTLSYGALVSATESMPSLMHKMLAAAAARVRDLDARRAI